MEFLMRTVNFDASIRGFFALTLTAGKEAHISATEL